MSTVLDALRKAERYGEQGRGGKGPPSDLPPTRPPRRRGPRVLLLVLAGVALVAAFAGGLELGNQEKEEETTTEAQDAAQVAAVDAPVEANAPSEPADAEEPAPKRKMDDGEDRLKAARKAAKERRAEAPEERSKNRFQTLTDRRNERRAVREELADTEGSPANQVAEKRMALIEQLRGQQRGGGESDDRSEPPRGATAPAPPPGRVPLAGAKAPSSPGDRLPSLNAPSSAPERLPSLNAPANDALPEPAAPPPEALASLRRGTVTAPSYDSAEPALREPDTQVASLPPRDQAPPAHMDEPMGGGAPAQDRGRAEPLRRPPSNAPRIRINILQWSLDPTRRFAYMSVEGGPGMTQVREGETFEGLTIKRILPEMVEFGSQDTTFMLRAN